MSTSTSSNRKRRTSKGEKARRQVEQEAEEERLLTASLFGGDSSAALLGRTQPQTVRLSKNESAPWFSLEIDRVGDATVDDDDDDNNGLKRGSEPTRQESLQRQDRFSLAVAAWVDEDDELAQLGLVGGPSRLKKLRLERSEQEPLTGSELHSRLRNRFQTTTQLTAHTEWANLKSNDQNISVSVEEKTEANEFDNANNSSYLSTSTTLLEPTSGHHSSMLPPNILNIKRCPDANISDVSKAALQVVQFHPGSDPDKPILLAAGFDKSLRFFSVSENSSTKLHGMHCKLLGFI